ncbi:T6SS immunity protein Tli4 family protein [Caballeronia zhejiangensis]|nr:T6SS immunity protein Tli4 family protein [Caballeronia zhejiangensis]
MRAIGAVLIGVAVLTSACQQKSRDLTEQEKKTVMNTTTDLKPRCVGRYLIDLPGDVRSAGVVKLQGVIVDFSSKTQEQFEHDMEQLEVELKATKSPTGYRYLYEYGKVRNIDHSRYFVSLGSRASPSDAVRFIEAYKWDRGYQIKLNIDAVDFLHSEDRDQPWLNDLPVKNDVPEKSRRVFDLLEKLEGRRDDVIPTQPGACFVGGFLPGKAVSEDEEIQSFFALPDKPDVGFSIETFGNMKPGDTLLRRIKDETVSYALKAAEGRFLRTGSFDTVGGMKAEESLIAALTVDTPPVHGFRFSLETNYASGAASPYLLLDMDVGASNFFTKGEPVTKASLTEGEAIALWDAVSRTLRRRPNAF